MQKENKSKFMNFLVKNRFLIAVLFISLFFRIVQYSNNIVWWDSAAYIEMGKYIFSAGSIGLWEDSRPLVLSFILGEFWKLGINPLVAGKILMIFFSLGTIWLTYTIARKIFNENIAVMASLMLSFSQTFFFYDTQILTGIPSLFFALLGLYLFLDKTHVLSGLVLCIAFMTRFLQLGVFAVLPFAPLTIPFLVTFGKRIGIDVIPDSFREEFKRENDLDIDPAKYPKS